jgi:hypothetical protein
MTGVCIIGSLAAISYWGPVGGHGFVSKDLHMIREERKSMHPDDRGRIPGNIEAVPAPPESDNYVVVRKKEQPPADKQKDQSNKDQTEEQK